MMFSLPYYVKIGEKIHNIRDKCDYRVILDIMAVLNDNELTKQEQVFCSLCIFYEEDLSNIEDLNEAAKKMFWVINGGHEEHEDDGQTPKPKLVDWCRDFHMIAPPVNRTLGYEVRLPEKYTHWWSFLGAYMEIGECTFSTILSIRSKLAKKQKLEKYEQDFYREHINEIKLPTQFSSEEDEFFAEHLGTDKEV